MIVDSSAVNIEQSQRCEIDQSKINSDNMNLDASLCEASKSSNGNVSDKANCSQGVGKITDNGVRKPVKRKRASIDGNVICTSSELRQEIDRLFEYYKELSDQNLNLDGGESFLNHSLIACLLEESNLAYSKLVEVICEKLKGRDGVTLAYVRSTVLSIGQRMIYGITKADADVLEDESESCLWCWETRDMKLLPANQRGNLNARRAGRKKIHERISALSALLSALAIPENLENYKGSLNKASLNLGKTLKVEEIRSLVEKKKQKNDTNMAEKAARLKEKESILEMQKEKLQREKEIKRLQEEAEKEAKRRVKEEAESKKQLKKQQEDAEKEAKRRVKEDAESKKQLKKQQEEAEKEAKRRLKEETESKKQLKKQQEEAEKDRQRRERAEAEMKKQRSVKKQATMMEWFLKNQKSNNNSDHENKGSYIKEPSCDLPCKMEVVNATTSLMDDAFSSQDNIALDDLCKLHTDSWHKLSHCNRSCHWGFRHNPKLVPFKELKLHDSFIGVDPLGKDEPPIREVASCKEINREENVNKLADWSENSCPSDNADIALFSVRLLRKKLLQFDKSNRPAYYGTWSKKSCAVGPRHPLKKDPGLEYDIDSDEEWEEEEPGESLSDCEKDADEECPEEEKLNLEDEEESEDDFFVPDGYLSENEGVQVDGKSYETDSETKTVPSDQSEVESEEIRALLQQQKYLQNLTEQALRKGHPLVISNLMHEKSGTKADEDLNGICKMEQMCLQALLVQVYFEICFVDISGDQCPENEDKKAPQTQNKTTTAATPHKAVISDSILLEYVSSIQSNSLGINKVIESLQGKFPSTPKSQLRNRVKEMSEYVDNRWQVKKEILDRLGLSTPPEKGLKPKSIATFFTKRCLPPEHESTISTSNSPLSHCSKTKVLPCEGGGAPGSSF